MWGLSLRHPISGVQCKSEVKGVHVDGPLCDRWAPEKLRWLRVALSGRMVPVRQSVCVQELQ
jgi:hypothetical protein